jgi:hypothetical protein
MPGAHRNTDDRICTAITKVIGQDSVFVNNLLWAVEGDIDTHCDEGALIASYGAKNVYINNKLVICAVGDTAEPDHEACVIPHPDPSTDPKGHSMDVIVYGGGAGGGSGA